MFASEADASKLVRHRRLLVDHIDHDLTRHLPQLLEAPAPGMLVGAGADAELRHGIEAQLRQRRVLYEDWAVLLAVASISAQGD